MNNGFTRFSTRTKLVAGALALVLAGVSYAGTTQVGGGGTLMSIGFAGSNAASNLQLFGTTGTNSISSGSLFGKYMAQSGYPGVSYCETGSGAGKDVLAGGTIGGNTYNVQTACTKNAAGTVLGFGAAVTGVARTDLTQPSFGNADAPIAASDLTNYQANHGTSDWPTQFPLGAGAIAIAVNLKDNTGAQITASEMNFTTVQLCKIFSHTVTVWNDSSLATAFTLPAGRSIPANSINVEYRSDGSGTTFGFSNFLANNCSGAGLAHDFEVSQAFLGAVVSGTVPPVTSNFFTTAPTGWTGASGNAAVATNVSTTASSIGYVEEANAAALSSLALQVADVNSKSPVTNFGTALPITSAAVVYNEVISSTNATNGAAQLTAIASPPSTKCIALVPPADYAIAGSKGGIIPSTSYPIVAVSYLLGNAQGNPSADLTNSQNLVDAPYNATITGGVTTFGSGTGLALLNLGTAPNQAFLPTAPGACLH